jgi:hypothetical protein
MPVSIPPVSKPVVATQPVAATVTQQPTSPSAPQSRKVSMNMLGDIEGAISRAAADRGNKPTEITFEKANELFERYKQELYDAGKGVIHSQFMMMRIEVPQPDEVCLISPHELTDTYGREQRTAMVEFYALHSGMTIRVTSKIVEDKSLMALLKEGVGLHIEY